MAAVGFQTVAAGIAAESVLAAAKIVGAGDGGHHTVRILDGPTAGSQGGGETGQEQGGSKGCKALVGSGCASTNLPVLDAGKTVSLT